MAQPPMFYQRSPDYESNMRMAQALMAQGGSTAPAATPLAALARVVQGGVGGFLQSRERDRDAARQKEYSTVLAQALQASEPWKNPDTSAVPGMNATERDATLGGGAGRRYLAPGEVAEGTGGPRAMIAALMGNEMTAPLGTQLQFQDIQNRQETERLLAVERAKPRAPVSVPSGAALVDPVTGMPVYTAPVKREQFTVSVGSNEVTYTGDPTDQSTWQKVGEAPRFPPPAPSAPRTVTTADGIFILRDDGTLGDRLGDPATNARGPMGVAPGGTVIDSATGQVVYQAPPPARNVQTATTGNGVFVVNPDGSLGQRLGDAPGATAKTPDQIRAEAQARAEGAAAGTPPKPQTPLEVLEARLGQMALDGTLDSREGQETLAAYRRVKGEKTADQLRDEAQASAEGRSAAEAGQREFEIKRYMQEYNLPRDVAQGVVDGVVKLSDNQQTGALTITNLATRKSELIEPAIPRIERGPLAGVDPGSYGSPATTGQTNDVYSGEAFGPVSALTQAWNSTIALFDPATLTVPRQEEAIRVIKFAREGIIDAMMKNDRGAIAEQTRIMDLLPQPGSFFANSEVATKNLTEVWKILARRRDRYANDLQSPRLTKQTREEADVAIRKIDSVLAELGIPPEVAASGASPAGSGAGAGAPPPPPGFVIVR